MPYLNSRRRIFLEHIATQIIMTNFDAAGELNYLFTLLGKQYVKCMGENYQTYNDIIGALEACKIELYRRKIASYEDKKIQENNDVY